MMARAPRAVVPAAVPLIDLMPHREVERRARAVLLRKWAWGVVAALAVVLIAVGATWWLRLSAELRLASAQATTTQLIEELGSMAEVSQALAMSRELETFRSAAMASDFEWTSITAQVDEVIPKGVVIAGFELFPGGVPQQADPGAEVGLQGKFILYSLTPLSMAETIRAVRDIAGVTMADGAQIYLPDEGEDQVLVYAYELQVVYDQTIYSGDFGAAEGGEG